MLVSEREYRVLKQRDRKLKIKVDILDENNFKLDEIQSKVISGGLSIDKDRLIRRCGHITLLLENEFKSNIYSKLWTNKRIKIWIGIYDELANDKNDEFVWFDQGIYLIKTKDNSISANDGNLSLELLDLMGNLDGTFNGTLGYKTKININAPLDNAIMNTTITIGKENNVIVENIIDENGKHRTVPYTLEKKATDNVSALLKELVDLYMYIEMFYNEEGYLIVQNTKTLLNDPIIWNFEENDYRINYKFMEDYSHIKNYVKIIGRTLEDKTTIFAEIKNEDSNSPYSIQNIGERILIIEDDKIFTKAQADLRAKYELEQHTNMNERISVTCIPIYVLKVNQLISFNDENLKGKYCIDKIDYDLKVDGMMNIEAHKIYR